jgi:hypothetical protein
MFQTPIPPQSPTKHPWAPPENFSPSKAFPQPLPQVELHDVDMSEVSPPKPEEGTRAMALGGMRRVYNSRRKRSKEKLRVVVSSRGSGDDGSDDEEDEHSDRRIAPRTLNTSNHYTLSLPSPAPPQSDLPYILLGCVYFLE